MKHKKSQITQALCTSSQAGFYRSRFDISGTMGALYWQLNDVWTTVSWASIDFSKRFKPLHYEMKKIFSSPISLVTNHNTNDILEVFVVSDNSEEIYVDLEIENFIWTSLETQGKLTKKNIKITGNKGNLILKEHIGFILQELNCPFSNWELCFLNVVIVSIIKGAYIFGHFAPIFCNEKFVGEQFL